MKLEEGCHPVFARHETFHPRFGWIGKAYRGGSSDERSAGFFNSDEAVIELGVGRNMVKSTRFWGHAFKVLRTEKIENSRLTRSVPSPIGKAMLAHPGQSITTGFDPYCELPGTLWLFHWWLLSARCDVPVWWLAFMDFSGIEFTSEELELYVEDRVQQFGAPPISAIRKDVACLLRMYLSENQAHSKRSTFDDVLDSPFRELGLIQPSLTRPETHRFQIGPKPSLPPLVLAFACADYLERAVPGSRSISIASLTHTPGSPGRAFKLTEAALEDGLRSASSLSDQVRVVNQSGANHLYLEAAAEEVGDAVLVSHYKTLGWRGEFDLSSRLTGWGAPSGKPLDFTAEMGNR